MGARSTAWRCVPISFSPSGRLAGHVLRRRLNHDQVELVKVQVLIRIARLQRVAGNLAAESGVRPTMRSRNSTRLLTTLLSSCR